jgi:hypothetical protein
VRCVYHIVSSVSSRIIDSTVQHTQNAHQKRVVACARRYAERWLLFRHATKRQPNAWLTLHPGVTGDTIGRLLQLTALNPALTLPLFLLAKYTAQGDVLAAQHASAFKYLKVALALGLAGKVSSWLDRAVTNNFSNDTYVWSREVVVVTGGSDGIGKIIVHLLAEKGIKVAVLDVQDLTYEGTSRHCPCRNCCDFGAKDNV